MRSLFLVTLFCLCLSLAFPGADVSRVARQDAGKVLADVVRSYMHDMGVVDGISAVGYTSEDIPDLVKGTIPQVTHH